MRSSPSWPSALTSWSVHPWAARSSSSCCMASLATCAAAARPWLELLFEIEDRLLALGEIQSDFVYLAARSRK